MLIIWYFIYIYIYIYIYNIILYYIILLYYVCVYIYIYIYIHKAIKDSIKTLQANKNFSDVAGGKINTQKFVALHYNNELSEREIK